MTISTVAAGTEVDPAWGNSVADAINAHENAWTSYAPTWTNLTVGASTTTAFYNEIGKTVFYRGKLVLGAGFSITGDLAVSLPVNADITPESCGTAQYLDNGTAWHGGWVILNGATGIEFHQPASGSASGRVTSTVPFTFVSGDIIYWNLTYEAA